MILLRTLSIATLVLLSVPASAQDELGEPTVDASIAAEATITPAVALREMDRLDLELASHDTSGPTALLVAGTATTIVGLGLGVGGGLGFAFNLYQYGQWPWGVALTTVGGAALIAGIVMITLGASDLVSKNNRRRSLQRRIDDYRRFLPRNEVAWTPLLWADDRSVAVGAQARF